MSDTQKEMGKLFPTTAKDAVHVAVIRVRAAHKMQPGDHIGVLDTHEDGDKLVGSTAKPIGIVDPFLEVTVKPGDLFFMYLYPNTITSLQHHWTHPSFPVTPLPVKDEVKSLQLIHDDVAESERWLRNFIDKSNCPSYEDVIDAIASGGTWDSNRDYGSSYTSDYLTFYGSDAHGEIPPEFWDHIEVVTGMKITKRPEYFSCSC